MKRQERQLNDLKLIEGELRQALEDLQGNEETNQKKREELELIIENNLKSQGYLQEILNKSNSNKI